MSGDGRERPQSAVFGLRFPSIAALLSIVSYGTLVAAQGLGQGPSGPVFIRAPQSEEIDEAHEQMILGIVNVETAIFVAVSLLAIFWFLFGGGRKAKLGRKGH